MFKKENSIGILTLVEREKIKGKWYWLCKCACGNQKYIREDSLKKKFPTQSCGCITPKFEKVDITNRQYGRLTVIEYTGEGRFHDEIWLCRCECGNIVKRTRGSLTSLNGKINSCGCRTEEMYIENSEKAIKKLKETNWIDNTSISKITRKTVIKSNTSGVTGVTWDKTRQKWAAQIIFKKKYYFLGRYTNKEDAIKARKVAEKKYHKNFLDWYENEFKKGQKQ